MANKDNIILINYLHLQFRSVNCLKIRRPLKKPPKLTFPGRSQMHFFRNFFANQYQDIYGRVPYPIGRGRKNANPKSGAR